MTDNQTPKKLTAKQVKALTAYFDLGEVEAACKEAGVNKSTFYRWSSEDEAFQAAMKEAESQALTMIGGQLVALASRAGEVLKSVLDSQTATTAQRLRAAEIVLNNLLRIRELVTLEERVAALERGINNGKP
jgi:hypothetical protein